MFDESRRRVREELQRLGIDACMVTTPANIFYTTGFYSPVVNLSFRLMGTDMALIPADPSLPAALMTSDFAAPAARAATSIEDVRTYRMWVENRDLDVITGPSGSEERISRPPQWNPEELDETITSMLEERGLSAATVGIDLRYVYADSLFRLQQNNPECQFVDVTGMLYGLRAIKHPQEIAMHRNAAKLFEAGLRRAIGDAHQGQSAQDIKYRYQAGALQAAMDDPSLGEFQSAYGFISAGTGSSFGDRSGLHSGDLIKFDCGVAVGGFYSDCGRTFAFGRPSGEQRRVHDAAGRSPRCGPRVDASGNAHLCGLPGSGRNHAGPRIPRIQPGPLRAFHRTGHLRGRTALHQRHRAQRTPARYAALPGSALLLRQPRLLPDRGHDSHNRDRPREFQHPVLRTGRVVGWEV